jgi:hypothetical protein
MPHMTRKKRKRGPDEPISFQVRLRDETLLTALEGFARQNRWSRNQALIVLLERALASEGLWHPPAAQSPPPV